MRKYATPCWANKTAIEELYMLARRLTLETGVEYEVDHIIPIRHPLVCGLHSIDNLRIITAQLNKRKSNFFLVN